MMQREAQFCKHLAIVCFVFPTTILTIILTQYAMQSISQSTKDLLKEKDKNNLN